MAVVTEEKTSADISEQSTGAVRRICFVCTGNTCRSPMAAAVTNALAIARAEEEGALFPHLIASSSGIFAHEGEPISAGAVRALTEAGVPRLSGMDYCEHRAHRLSHEDLARYDLFVCLSDGHVMDMMLYFPEAAPKIMRMPHAISDPFGGSDAVYLRCLDEITRGVKELFFKEENNHEN